MKVNDVLDDDASLTQFPGNVRVHGNFTQRNGILQVAIGASDGGSDRLAIDGTAALDGTLAIRPALGFVPIAGQSFQFIAATGGTQGTFRNVDFPTLSGTLWHLVYGPGSVSLVIDSAATTGIVGDYNGDGVVDAADYTVWRETLGSTTRLAADGNGNGIVDSGDFEVWKANFGNHSGSGASAAVPEPSTLALLVVGILVMSARRRPTIRLQLDARDSVSG